MDSMEHDERKKGVNPGQELLQDREPAAGPRSSRRRRPPGRSRGRISHDGSRAAGRRDQRHAGGAQVRERRRHDADVTAPRPNVVLSVGQRVKYVGRVQKYRYR
ncbi:MAG: hypothetical protein IRY98_09960, partial [Alicyclobacillaceae bacterium]|nr:hypothetical protein [Alicyclobacillaceae bacterium]